MDKKFRELIIALATDSRVLADYQIDKLGTMARFQVTERIMLDAIEILRVQSTFTANAFPAAVGKPVTH